MQRLRDLLRLDHIDDPDSPWPVHETFLKLETDRVFDCCWHLERLEELVERSATISAGAARLLRAEAPRPHMRSQRRL